MGSPPHGTLEIKLFEKVEEKVCFSPMCPDASADPLSEERGETLVLTFFFRKRDGSVVFLFFSLPWSTSATVFVRQWTKAGGAAWGWGEDFSL